MLILKTTNYSQGVRIISLIVITGFTTFTSGWKIEGGGIYSNKPSSSNQNWTSDSPTSYIFLNEGTKTLYAWAKDAAGNVSASFSASSLYGQQLNIFRRNVLL